MPAPPTAPGAGGRAAPGAVAGVVQDGEAVFVYYGAADAFTAVAKFLGRELFDAMTAPD